MGSFCKGPKTTTTTQQQGQQTAQQQQSGTSAGQSTVTPNLPQWLTDFYQNIPGLYGNITGQLQSMAQQPLYGPRQQANFQQQLGQQYGQAQQNLLSNLASRGALNSGAGNIAQTQLALGQGQQLGNYLAQTPLLNAQYKQSVLGQLGNTTANAGNFRPPVIGQTTNDLQSFNDLMNSLQQMSSSGTQTQQTSGGLLQSLLGGLLGAGLNMATGGLSGVSSGGGGGLLNTMQNTGQLPNFGTAFPVQPPPFQ